MLKCYSLRLLPGLAEHPSSSKDTKLKGTVEQWKDSSQNEQQQGTGGRVQIRWESDPVKRQQDTSEQQVEFKPGKKGIISRGNKRPADCCSLNGQSTTCPVCFVWSRCSLACYTTFTYLECNLLCCCAGDSSTISFFMSSSSHSNSHCSTDSRCLLRLSFICLLCTWIYIG